MKPIATSTPWIVSFLVLFSTRAPAQTPVVEFFSGTVDSVADVGTSASIAVDEEGHPHIGYLDVTNHTLRYVYGDDLGWHLETVAAADIARNCSLALEPDGTPIIVFSRDWMVRSVVRHAGGWVQEDVGGFAPWACCVTTGSDGSVHAGFLWSTSGGNYEGHISYALETNGSWDGRILESSGSYFVPTNPHCAIAVTGSFDPMICLSNHASHELRCFRRHAGTWSNSRIGYGTWSSIAFGTGEVPHVSFYDTETHQLRLAIETSSGWSVGVVDDEGDVGQYSSLGFGPGGEAHIAYYDATERNLKWAHIAPFDAIWTIQVVDSQGDVGRWASLDVDSHGDVHIAYYDVTNGNLRYATTSRSVPVASGSWGGLKALYRPHR